MAAIRSKNTVAELLLRKSLSQLGLKYRLYSKNLPGKPDFVLHKNKTIVFVDGDFWHGRKWAARKKLGFRVRSEYWIKKIESNIARDKRNNKILRKEGWLVIRLWESSVKAAPDKAAQKIKTMIKAARSKE